MGIKFESIKQELIAYFYKGGYIMKINSSQLDYICEKIIEKISNKQTISEKMILDLSIFIAYMINNKFSFELPDSYQRMEDVVEDYWFYSSSKDDNKEACLSYIRVYQTINLYKVYIANNKYQKRIQEDSVRFKRQFNLIKKIYDNPGIRQQDFHKLLKISATSLKTRINDLIEQGYVYISKIGNNSFYSLSNSGLDLYRLLSGEDNE